MNNNIFGLYDQEGHLVNHNKRNDGTIEVWFHGMNPTKEGCIWTGNLDELVYEEELEVKYIRRLLL